MRIFATIQIAAVLLALTLCTPAFAHGGAASADHAIAAGVNPPKGANIGGEFELLSQDGRSFRLGAATPRYTLVAFGFTQCSETCPTALVELSRLAGQLPAAQMPQVVFVTLDPQRDTPDVLREYLSAFDPRFIGLTGPSDRIARVSEAYLVAVHKIPDGDGYAIEHSAYTYLLDERGRVIRLYRYGTPAEVIAREIKRIAPVRAALR